MLQAKLPPNIPNNDQLIKWHHKAIGEMIDSVIRNIDFMNESIDELRSIGATHAQFYDDGMKVFVERENLTVPFCSLVSGQHSPRRSLKQQWNGAIRRIVRMNCVNRGQ